jgi:hypothetical protein
MSENPFKTGPLAIVDVTHAGSAHDAKVLGPAMHQFAYEFHQRLHELTENGMCGSCAAISMFSTITANVLGGIPAEMRPHLVDCLKEVLDDMPDILNGDLAVPAVMRIAGEVTHYPGEEASSLAKDVDELIRDIKKMH